MAVDLKEDGVVPYIGLKPRLFVWHTGIIVEGAWVLPNEPTPQSAVWALAKLSVYLLVCLPYCTSTAGGSNVQTYAAQATKSTICLVFAQQRCAHLS